MITLTAAATTYTTINYSNASFPAWAFRRMQLVLPWRIIVHVGSEPREASTLDCDTLVYQNSRLTLPGQNDVFHCAVEGSITGEADLSAAIPNDSTWNRTIVLEDNTSTTIHYRKEADGYIFDVAEVWTVARLSKYHRVRTDGTVIIYDQKTGQYLDTQRWMDVNDNYSGEVVKAIDPQDCAYLSAILKNSIPITPGSFFWKNLTERLDEELPYGDLTQQAVEDARVLDINTLAYLGDFAKIGSLLHQIGDIARVIKHPTALSAKSSMAEMLKTMSSAYLLEHYGIRLGISDTKKILDGVDRVELTRTMRYGAEATTEFPQEKGGPMQALRRCTLDIDAVTSEQAGVLLSVKQMKRTLYDLDVVPSLENIWDLVPYSFVLDWFLPIGQYFEYKELNGFAQTLPVRAAYYATKVMWDEAYNATFSDGTKFEGNLTFRCYQRQCRGALELPPFRPDSPKGLSNHWLEATALLITHLL